MSKNKKLTISEYAEKYLDIKLLPMQLEMIKMMDKNQFKDVYWGKMVGKTTATKVWNEYQQYLKAFDELQPMLKVINNG